MLNDLLACNVGILSDDFFCLGCLTADEAKQKTRVMADIETYVYETIPKFITGDESLDKFDAFVEQIKAMGIADIIKIQQAALDRYQNR